MGKPGKMIGISIVIIVVTVISLVLALPSSAETYSGNCGANGSNVKWSLDTAILRQGDRRNDRGEYVRAAAFLTFAAALFLYSYAFIPRSKGPGVR